MKIHCFDTDNAVSGRIMAATEIPDINLHEFPANLGPDLYFDHVHFHPAIRALQGAFLADGPIRPRGIPA